MNESGNEAAKKNDAKENEEKTETQAQVEGVFICWFPILHTVATVFQFFCLL